MYWNKNADVQWDYILKLGHQFCLISTGYNVLLNISAYSSLVIPKNSHTVFSTGQLSYFDSER